MIVGEPKIFLFIATTNFPLLFIYFILCFKLVLCLADLNKPKFHLT